MSPPDPAEKGKRGIDSIAHLFLSQNNSSQSRPPVHRKPPQVEDHKTPQHHPGLDEDDASEPAPAEILISAHLRHPVRKAGLYAAYLTRRGDDIRLVNVDSYEAALIKLESLSSQPRDDWDHPGLKDSLVLCETEDIQNCLIPTLVEAAYDCDNLLINIDPSFMNKTAELMASFSHITILTECSKDSIIETYQAVKKWSSYLRSDQELGLFICEAPDNETADEVYYKIADTTRQFLKKVIVPAGCHVVPGSYDDEFEEVAEVEAEQGTIVSDAEESVRAEGTIPIQPAINESHLEELASIVEPVLGNEPEDHAENPGTLDAEMNENPSAEIGTEPNSNQTASQEQVTMYTPLEISQSRNESHQAPPKLFPAVYAPVSLHKLPGDDRELLQVLQNSLAQWLVTIPGALPVPLPDFGQFEQPALLLLDGAGRFHVLAATLSSQIGLLESALEYRQWFLKNRMGLMRMFQQLQFNPGTEPGIILIKPSYSENQKTAARSLPAMTCQLMSLCFFEMGENKGMLVTPLS